jgi:alpha-L-fucosidase
MHNILVDTFKNNLAVGASVYASQENPDFPARNTLDSLPDTYWTTEDWQESAVLTYELDGEKTFNVVLLMEHISIGQRIEKFVIEVHTLRGWERVAKGGTVGYKRLLRIRRTSSNRVRVRILESRFAPTLSRFGLFMENL